jgi:hypothetical protein
MPLIAGCWRIGTTARSSRIPHLVSSIGRGGFAVQRYDRDGWRVAAELRRVKYSRKVTRCVFRGEPLTEKKP